MLGKEVEPEIAAARSGVVTYVANLCILMWQICEHVKNLCICLQTMLNLFQISRVSFLELGNTQGILLCNARLEDDLHNVYYASR